MQPARARALDLMILDDIFPSLTSGFRLAEYHELARRYPRTRVFSASANLARDFFSYQKAYPGHAALVRPLADASAHTARLAFLLFLNNAANFLPIVESQDIPFLFSLNPGGGFHLGERSSDAKLRRVFASPCFRHVIVTQRISLAYLHRHAFCPRDKITFHFGGVVPSLRPLAPIHFPDHKDHCDVSFVAAKYDPLGRDKGYDVFVDLIRLLHTDSRFRFHVAGGFGPRDLPLPENAPVKFYGHIPNHSFPEFFRRMDFIVSPNRPAMLHPGSFDGFPTGCCNEAALCGAVPIVTDPLRLKPKWPRDCVPVVEPDARHIADRILALVADPLLLQRTRRSTQATLGHCFSLPEQMRPRFRIIDAALARPPLQAG